jgi:hypothetical protein
MSAPPVYGQQNGYGPPANGQQYQQPAQQGPPAYGPPAQQPAQAGPPPGQTAGEQNDASYFNGASGAPALGFPKGEYGVWKGGIYTGRISTKQASTMKTESKPSEPRFWPSGEEVVDVVVEVLSADRDANNPLDDGRRRMFVTQENTNIPDSKASVTKAETAGGFHRGGQIYWCKVSQRMGSQNMRDVWACQYRPPTAETLAILDALPPQGISQAGADSVAASYQQPGQTAAGPFVAPAQQGPPPQQYAQQPPAQQGPPAYGQPAPQGPPVYQGQPQYQQPAAAQGYGPPAGQQGPPPQQYAQQPAQHGYGPPAGAYGPPPAEQPPAQGYPQQGAPAQTHNPYGQPAQGNPYQQ